MDYELEPIEDELEYELEPIEEEESFGKKALKTIGGYAHTARAIAETGAGLATGLAAFPISKGTKWIEYALSGGDLEKAKAAEMRANERIQFQPETEEASGAMEQLGKYVFEPVFGTLNKAGRFAIPKALVGMGLIPPGMADSPDLQEASGDIAEIGGPMLIGAGIKAGKKLRERPTEVIPERPRAETKLAEEIKPERIEAKDYVLEEIKPDKLTEKPVVETLPETKVDVATKRLVEPEPILEAKPDLSTKMETPAQAALKEFEGADIYKMPKADLQRYLDAVRARKVEIAEAKGTAVISPEALEPMIKGGSTAELPKYSKGSSINLERLNTTQDIKQLQNIMTQAAEKEIGKRRVSWDETRKAAEDLAWDSKEFLKQAKKKDGFSAAEIESMRQINTNSLHDLFNTIQDMPADISKRTDASRLAVLDQLNNYVEVMKETSRKSSEAGRALNIHKKMMQDNPEFALDSYRQSVLKQMMDSLGGKEMTDQMISDLKVIDFKDPIAVRNVIQKYHKSGLFDKIYEAWLNSILSAPTSHAANVLGNTLSLAVKIPETAIRETLSGKSPTGIIRAESVGMWQGLKEGIRAGVKAFQTGVPSDMLTKIEHQRYSAIPGKFGETVRTPTRALTAADEFFKSIIYRSELNAKAYSIAKSEGLSGKPLAERMLDVTNNPLDPLFQEIHNAARNESLYRTFNKPLGKMGSHVMQLRDEVPGLRYVIPFIRTPINIAKFALERTPFQFGKIMHDYRKGKISASELNAELAKPIVGSLLSAATTMAVLEGNITGAPPKDKKDRDLLYATGWQPYSLKIGDKYVSYNRLEPIGSILGMTTDFVDAVRDDESDINERAGKIMMSFSRNIASKTYLQSISGFLDAISDPDRYGGGYIEKLAGSVVPSIVAAGARAVDPNIHEVENPLEAIQARIPYASKGLPTKVGAYQMPLERPGSALGRFLSPITISEEKEDMALIVGAELEGRRLERLATKLQKKTLREALRESRKR